MSLSAEPTKKSIGSGRRNTPAVLFTPQDAPKIIAWEKKGIGRKLNPTQDGKPLFELAEVSSTQMSEATDGSIGGSCSDISADQKANEAADTNTIDSYDTASQEGKIKQGSDISKMVEAGSLQVSEVFPGKTTRSTSRKCPIDSLCCCFRSRSITCSDNT